MEIQRQTESFAYRVAGPQDRVQPYVSGQKLYRGVAVPIDPSHPLVAQIQEWLGDQDYDDTYGQHLKVGPALLDHIVTNFGGLGSHWSEDPTVSDDFARIGMSNVPGMDAVNVLLTATHPGQEWEVPEEELLGSDSHSHEFEHKMRPGAPMSLTSMKIFHNGHPLEVLNPDDDDPDYGVGGMRGKMGGPQVREAKVGKTIRLSAYSERLINKLQSEFDGWFSTLKPEEISNGGYRSQGPIGDWRNIENFLQAKYPAAYRGLDMGFEEAQPVMDAKSLSPEVKFYRERHPAPPRAYRPYETGQEAYDQYGYDPKEIAAGMLLLHNRSQPFRTDLEEADIERLNDIAQKRHQMQQQSERRKQLVNASIRMAQKMIREATTVADYMKQCPVDDKGRILMHRGVGEDFPHMTFHTGPDPTGHTSDPSFHWTVPETWEEALNNIRSENNDESYGQWWGNETEARSYAGDDGFSGEPHGSMMVSAWWNPEDLSGSDSEDGVVARSGSQAEVENARVYVKGKGWVALPDAKGKLVTAYFNDDGTEATTGQDLTSVAESLMENVGHIGRHFHVPRTTGTEAEELGIPYWDLHHQRAAEAENFVNDVLAQNGHTGEKITIHPHHRGTQLAGAIAATNGWSMIGLRDSDTTALSLLHECAHILTGSTEEDGHTPEFQQILRKLYRTHISPEAGSLFGHVVGLPDDA